MAGRALGVLLRAAVLIAVLAGYAVVLNNSDSTDALSAGLLAFLILVVIAFAWSVVDGIRLGFLVGVVGWVLTSAIAGVGIPVVIAINNDTAVADEIGDSGLFFAILLLVPALVGLAVGGLVHRIRGRDEVAATG